MTMAGLIGMTVGALMLCILPTSSGVVGYLLAIVVITVAYASFQTANNTAVMTGIKPQQKGVISGLLNLSRNLGLITGASLMGYVFAKATAIADTAMLHPAAVARGMRVTFAVAALAIVAALIVAVINRSISSKPAPC
jgi:predicted MFS family arabinose efflux permease